MSHVKLDTKSIFSNLQKVNHCSGTNGALLFAALYYRKSMQPRVFHRSESQVRVLEELLKAGADPHVKHYSENRNDVVILPLLSILNSAIDHDGKLVDLFVKYGKYTFFITTAQYGNSDPF